MTSPTCPTGMTIPCFLTAGPLQIWTNTGSAYASEFLGWTRGGISIQEQKFFSELKSDLSGGEQGPPGDIQLLGFQHTIDCELAQFDAAILAKLERRINAAVTTITRGMLESCSSANFRVLFIGPSFGRLYTRVFVNEPITYAPIGTAATFPRIVFTALDDTRNTDLLPWCPSNGGSSPGYSFSGSTVTMSPAGP